SISIAKGLLSGPQADLFAQGDKDLEHALKQILQQCAGSERANLVRWKLRRFFDSLATENSVKLERRSEPPALVRAPAPAVKRVSGWFQYTPPRGWTASYTNSKDLFRHE